MSDTPSRIRLAFIWLGLFITFLKELLLSATTVAWAVLNPGKSLNPAIVAVPLDLRTDWRISVLANIVTLTPGTTSLHVSDDLATLYVHVMDCNDPEEVVRSIKDVFEVRILKTEPSTPSPRVRARPATGETLS